jgi:hypothetical protein
MTMVNLFRSPIEELVDLKFANLDARPGDTCTNPVHGGRFVFGADPISTQKQEAVHVLRLREWFAVNSPAGTPPLPITHDEIEEYRRKRGVWGIIGFFARSLMSWEKEVTRHPSFIDYACGLMSTDTGWGLENDPFLKKRFPPRPLAGLDETARCRLPAYQAYRRAA